MALIDEIKLEENLKRLIEKNNISIHLLSARSGVNKSTIHNYLNGVVPQGLSTLLKLCEFFSISLEELVFIKIYHEEAKSKNLNSQNSEEKYEITIKKISCK